MYIAISNTFQCLKSQLCCMVVELSSLISFLKSVYICCIWILRLCDVKMIYSVYSWTAVVLAYLKCTLFFILHKLPNRSALLAASQVGYFWVCKDAEFIGNTISIDIYECLGHNSVTYFYVQFLLLVCFYTVVEIKWLQFIILKLSSEVGWKGFNSTFSTKRPYRAIKKIKLC